MRIVAPSCGFIFVATATFRSVCGILSRYRNLSRNGLKSRMENLPGYSVNCLESRLKRRNLATCERKETEVARLGRYSIDLRSFLYVRDNLLVATRC
jgi:hypothetical protein